MATYLTLGLADIAKVIKVESGAEVRNLWYARISIYFYGSRGHDATGRYLRPDMSYLNSYGLQGGMEVMDLNVKITKRI